MPGKNGVPFYMRRHMQTNGTGAGGDLTGAISLISLARSWPKATRRGVATDMTMHCCAYKAARRGP